MAQYTVRVELHYADNDDYETLHSEMENAGFSRLITSNDGITYHLPTAEYNRSGSLTPEQVLASAKSAAAQTRRKASILVTKSESRKWLNLEAA
jgi:hypothetical protein